jgi:hypothetical protein
MRNLGKALSLMLVLIFITSLVTVLSAMPVHAALSWNIQTIDKNSAIGDSPIAVDSNNITHIAYSALISDTYFIVYASSDGSGWSTQTVATGVSPSSLVLDTHNNPQILYISPYPQQRPLMYASWTGTNWNIQNTNINNSGNAVLALDASGNPHIAYTDGKAVKYASWTESNWNIQTVDSFSSIPFKLYLALDSHNKPNILYAYTMGVTLAPDMGWTYENAQLAQLKDSSWKIENLSLNINDFGNLILDSKGFPHFTCEVLFPELTGLGNSTLFYVSWNGTAWNTDPVVSNTYITSIGSLALDSNDYPHVVYIIPAPDGLTKIVYASWIAGAWDSQI